MTDRYLWSGATGTATGLSWANAKTTLVAMIATPVVAGDRIFVAHDHSETTAGSISATPGGTAAAPMQYICVNRAGSVPPVNADLRTSALVATSGANALTIGSGTAYLYGISFVAGSGTTSANFVVGAAGSSMTFDTCSFSLGTTTTASIFTIASGNMAVDYINCTFNFSAVGQTINTGTGGRLRILGGAVTGTAPTTLWNNINIDSNEFRGVDLSLLGAGNNLVGTAVGGSNTTFANCKLGAGVTVVSGAWAAPTGNERVLLENCDSGATNYRNEVWMYAGSIVQETTVVRSGGASNGVTPMSHKFTTNANALFALPVARLEYVRGYYILNDITGASKIASVEIINDGTTLNNDDIWMEVSYLGNASFPIETIDVSTMCATLATNAPVPTSTATWTTTGLVTPIKQKLSATITPQMKGPIKVIVRMVKPSKVVYVDPMITLV